MNDLNTKLALLLEPFKGKIEFLRYLVDVVPQEDGSVKYLHRFEYDVDGLPEDTKFSADFNRAYDHAFTQLTARAAEDFKEDTQMQTEHFENEAD